jgi:hypothetical protein
MKEPLLDDETFYKMLNALLMMFLASGIWGWLIDIVETLNLPFNPFTMVMAVGVIAMVFDVKDYQYRPKPKPLLVGVLLMPIWLACRVWMVKR